MEALRLLKIYTAGSCIIYNLAGPAKASCRAHIMSAIKGRKMPQSQSGITALTREFYTLAQVTGNCGAAREENFINWAKSQQV